MLFTPLLFTPRVPGEFTAVLAFRSNDPITGLDRVTVQGMASEPPGRPFRRGESDVDGRFNLTDAVFTLRYIFLQGDGPFLQGDGPLCQDSTDADGNGRINITDAVMTLDYLFQGGEPLLEPGSSPCGVDATDDALPECDYPSEQC